MENEKNIYFDLETAGLDPEHHPIIQIAGIAVNGELRELESIELKKVFAQECPFSALDEFRWSSFGPFCK